ncbi:hypothetical protein NC651_007132 [Populus alba x Populus x berolinensis]|nr:hypothetical protein NC651_007132 [Populus alba x Populus x berolinensis]
MRARACHIWIVKFQKQVRSLNCLFNDNQVRLIFFTFPLTYISFIYIENGK